MILSLFRSLDEKQPIGKIDEIIFHPNNLLTDLPLRLG
jgi:hypothetical protein